MYGCHFCGRYSDDFSLYPDTPIPPCRNQGCSTCKRLQTLNAQIRKLQDSVAVLLEEQRQLRSQYNHASHPSIVNSLPHELSTQIFSFYVQMREPGWGDLVSGSQSPGGSIIDSPLLLGAVCRTWRQFVWSSPSLWTSLRLYLDRPISPAGSISRSAQLPLSVQLEVLPPENDFGEDDDSEQVVEDVLLPLIQFLNVSSHRWSSLDLTLPSFVVASYSRYRRVFIRLPSAFSCLSRYNGSPLNITQVAPKELTITSGVALKDLRFKLENLNRFSANDVQPSDVFEVTRRAPELISCRFLMKTSWGLPQNYIHSPPFVHSQIKSLAIFLRTEDTARWFFNGITLPSLTQLETDLPMGSPSTTSFLYFLQRSKCILETLSLSMDRTADSKNIVEILRNCPSLHHLSLNLRLAYDITSQRFPCLDGFYSALSGHLSPSEVPIEPILPGIKTFKLIGGQTFCAKLISGLFAPSAECEDVPLRALEAVEVRIDYHAPVDGPPPPLIDPTTLSSILNFRQRGVAFDLKVAGDDLIQLSINKGSEGNQGE
ncbi:LOW QUALITY PROTEIN: hypothetical protein CVT26_009141 [Gymnopilus dilepis]|uniref:Uncharacterized protein n=1 Tax=Gymnopilus dilepis TaxID=231916 RepID=A0A409YRI4_9AGAR|nr:LOW QUALITY PROTEIN: hypothetical protein CVT26_009141 [Gymnopilus dilepis]